MPADRFYLEKEWNSNDFVSLEDTEFHHLVNVMRVKVGASIELVNGRGSLAMAEVKKLEKKSAYLLIKSTTLEPPPRMAVILAQAIPRMSRLDFILEKGTELGMTELWLFPGAQGERKLLTEHQLERMKAVIISAMKQCGRLYLPKLMQTHALQEWTSPPKEQQFFYGSVLLKAPVFEIKGDATQKGIIFVIGPESGLSELEIQKLEELGAQGVRLHQNILRTDTASLVALALINHRILL